MPTPEETQQKLNDVANSVHQTFMDRLRAGQFDNMTISDLKVKAATEADQLLKQDESASIVSIVVALIFI